MWTGTADSIIYSIFYLSFTRQRLVFSRTVEEQSPQRPSIQNSKHVDVVVVCSLIGRWYGLLHIYQLCLQAVRMTVPFFLCSALAVIGFLCTFQSVDDITTVFSNLDAAVNYAPTYQQSISNNINEVRRSSLSAYDALQINARLVLTMCWNLYWPIHG